MDLRLLNGTPFYEGIYPEAMHCFIYAMRVLFGVKIYSSQLFLAGIHVAVFLVSAYLLLKELFAGMEPRCLHWRCS